MPLRGNNFHKPFPPKAIADSGKYFSTVTGQATVESRTTPVCCLLSAFKAIEKFYFAHVLYPWHGY
jgi:hypothetical protein